MILEVVPFRREQLPVIGGLYRDIPEDALDRLEKDPWSGTVTVDGLPMFCGGIALVEGRAELWAVLSPRCKGNPLLAIRMRRFFKNVVSACPLQPVMARVRLGHNDGHRAVRAVGFRVRTGSRLWCDDNGVYYAFYDQVVK